MAIKYGFFNSVNGDRKYTAADIGDYLRGIIYSGVYPDGASSLQVLAAGGMAVEVQPGRAMLEFKYLENDAPHQITLAAGGTMDRIDAIVAYMDLNERACGIVVKEGTPAAAPVAPAMTRTDVRYEVMLASVYVTRLVNEVTQANITDTRHLTEVCGWVRGAIRQNTADIPVPAPATAGYIPHVTQDGNGYELLAADTTLAIAGRAADAAATGRALAKKAPAGYGLGSESLREVTLAELESLDGNGWYFINNNQTGVPVCNVYFNYALLRITSSNTGWNSTQEIFTLTVDGARLIRSRKSNTEWYDWECENPPMVPGKEYRTTERRNGLAVYTKLVEVGALPNNTRKDVSIGVSASKIFRTEVSAYNYSAEAHSMLPYTNSSGEVCGYTIWGTDISIASNANFSAYSASVHIWYVK